MAKSNGRPSAAPTDAGTAEEESRATRFMKSALAILGETGRADFTVLEVVERSKTSLRSFYQHFSTKDELLLALIDRIMAESTNRWREETNDLDGPTALRRLIDRITMPASSSKQDSINRGLTFYNYHLAELNDAARSDRAGEFKIALMPGETHECYGFAKFYNMTKMAADRGEDVVKACGDFIQYFAGEIDGEYPIAKRWAVENGLGFGQKPLLEDPDVQAAFSKWIDLDTWGKQLDLARAQRHTPWQGIWNEFFRLEHVQATAGEISVDDALNAAAVKWTELQQQFGAAGS